MGAPKGGKNFFQSQEVEQGAESEAKSKKKDFKAV